MHILMQLTPQTSMKALRSLLGKLESIQYQAALPLTGSWQGSTRPKLYVRRKYRRVLLIHKILLFRILRINYHLTAEKCLVEVCVLLFMQ